MKKLNLAPYQVRRYVTPYGSGWLLVGRSSAAAPGEVIEYYDDEQVDAHQQAKNHRNRLNSKYCLDKIGV